MNMRNSLTKSGLNMENKLWSKILATRRKTGVKKTLTRFGEIEIAKANGFSEGVNGFQISPYMQEKMVYAGQTDSYNQCNEILSVFLLADVSVTQTQRVLNTYGSLLEEERTKPIVEQPAKERISKKEVVYAQVDGGMIFTREEGWSEVKVGRIFKASDCMEIGGNRGWIKHSEYEAWLGGHKQFCNRFEQQLDNYRCLKERLVFVSDGAVWIKNWIEDAYPEATLILDWFHAKEHLCKFAELYLPDKNKRDKWVEKQSDLLYESKVEKVINTLKKLKGLSKHQDDGRVQLINYYTSNKNRMDYVKYRSMGAGIIGSGAIEAAHRNLVQKRMKLSGQRWKKKGAQNMLAIRVARLSNRWDKVVTLITNPIAKAA